MYTQYTCTAVLTQYPGAPVNGPSGTNYRTRNIVIGILVPILTITVTVVAVIFLAVVFTKTYGKKEGECILTRADYDKSVELPYKSLHNIQVE